MDETFSSIDLVTQCLMDEERTLAFQKAINEVVKPGSVVLDSGTGSGVLAMFSAKAGAKKVYALEIDPYVAKLAAENVKRNGLDHIVEVINADIRNYPFEGVTFDVVTMEMLTTGMIDEYQVWAVNQLHGKSAITDKTVFLPCKQDTFVTLVNADYNVFGLNMTMPLHIWKGFDSEKNVITDHISDKVLLNSIRFNQTNDESFATTVTFTARKAGKVNAIHLESDTYLTETFKIGDTLALNAPVVYPLENEVELEEGQQLTLEIKYFFGNGYRNFHIKFV